MNIVVIDTETTGKITSIAEILQVSIISGSGMVLFNEYIKPTHTTSWPEAQAINHISPAKVKNCKTIDHYASKIQNIIDNADIVVGYNLKAYDIPILAKAGIYVGGKIVDVYLENRSDASIARHRLMDVAKKFGYIFTPHDALEDCRATLHIYNKTHPVKKRKTRTRSEKLTEEIIEEPALSADESNLSGRILKKLRTVILIAFGIALITVINRYAENYLKEDVSLYTTMAVVGLFCYLSDGLTGALTGVIGYFLIQPKSSWNKETASMELSILLTAVVLRLLFKYTKRYKNVIFRFFICIAAIAVASYVFFILYEFISSKLHGVPFVLRDINTGEDSAVRVAVWMISALPLYMVIARILKR